MAGVVGTDVVVQIGFIVKDVEETKRKWAEFLGQDVPPTKQLGNYEVTQTVYHGEPDPGANCVQAFFDVGPGLQIELIEPNDEPSTWRDFLNEKGEGIHHIAFKVKDSAVQVGNAEAMGLKLIQHGTYGDGSGEYNYLDSTADLKCIVELLESYRK